MPSEGERLYMIEIRVNHLEESHREIKTDVNSVKKTIWTAAGAVGVLIFIVEVIVKH